MNVSYPPIYVKAELPKPIFIERTQDRVTENAAMFLLLMARLQSQRPGQARLRHGKLEGMEPA